MTYAVIAALALTAACGDSSEPELTPASTQPSPTAMPTAIPTPAITAADPTPTPMRFLTQTPRVGLGLSVSDVRDLARPMGYLFEPKDDRTIVRGGTVNLVLFPPYDNLSKAQLLFAVDADDLDVIDVTAFMFLFTRFETGDITRILEAFVQGKAEVQTNFGDVQVHAELFERIVIAITFTPR